MSFYLFFFFSHSLTFLLKFISSLIAFFEFYPSSLVCLQHHMRKSQSNIQKPVQNRVNTVYSGASAFIGTSEKFCCLIQSVFIYIVLFFNILQYCVSFRRRIITLKNQSILCNKKQCYIHTLSINLNLSLKVLQTGTSILTF